jgi:hypothetical protein
MSVLQDVINKHKERLEENPKSDRQDFIDYYLDEIRSGAEPTCTGIEPWTQILSTSIWMSAG